MAQVATQRTTGATRFRGPMVVTMRGAGSKGHDYKLGGVAAVGVGIDPGLSVQIPVGQTANAIQLEQPDGTVIAAFDAAGGLVQSGVLNISLRAVQVTLTAAQIITLHSVPVLLVAAPGAGKALIVDAMLFQFKYGTVQMTGGGATSAVYHGATTNLLAGSVAAATITAAANATISAGSLATALAVTTNVGVDLYAASADFAAGDSTAVVTLWYTLYTLQ
jgi:hypothetical protein